MNNSKSLGHDDYSGFSFIQRALNGNVTAAINFDRIQKHPQKGYIIFELLKCDASQIVTPYTSHPNKYWNKNARKFLSLWRVAKDLDATLYLVNYADAGTIHEDEVLVIEVLDLNEFGISKETKTKYTMDTFSKWFIDLNEQCLSDLNSLKEEVYANESAKNIGNIIINQNRIDKPYYRKTIREIFNQDVNYLCQYCNTDLPYAKAVKAYLKKRINPESICK